MNSINLEAYKEYFPDSGSVRINHCRAEESNRKFYLTRTETGDVIGYCHHCGGRGVYRPSCTERRTLPTVAVDTTSDDPFKRWGVPSLATWKTCDRWKTVPFEDLPLLTRKWWFKNGLNVSEYEDIGVRMLDGNRFTIPLRSTSSWDEVTGVAIRTFKDDLPKWIVLGSKTVHPFTQADTVPDTLVLTEDYCSALRVSRSYTALPLMGISLNSNVFSLITKWHKEDRRVVIWLDNDSRAVVQQAKEIRRQLALTIKCGIILVNKEPKHYINDADLREVIHGD